MSLKQFIRTPVLTMSETDTVMDAINLMTEKKAGAVLIIEGKKLKGIFTERDVMVKIVAGGVDPKVTALKDAMTTELIKVSNDTEFNEAVHIMAQHRIRHLPVITEEDETVGMISLRSLLHEKIDVLMGELRSLEAYFNDAPGG